MNMPAELKQALEAAHGGPIEIVDGERRYVLVRAEDYQHMKDVVESDDWDPAAMKGAMGRVMRDDWNNPNMDNCALR